MHNSQVNTVMCELGFCPLSMSHTHLKRGRGAEGLQMLW